MPNRRNDGLLDIEQARRDWARAERTEARTRTGEGTIEVPVVTEAPFALGRRFVARARARLPFLFAEREDLNTVLEFFRHVEEALAESQLRPSESTYQALREAIRALEDVCEALLLTKELTHAPL